MLSAVPLTDDERAAVDEGQAALDKLFCQLAGTPTPAGPTRRQLGHHAAGPPLPQILPGPPAWPPFPEECALMTRGTAFRARQGPACGNVRLAGARLTSG